MLTRAMEHCDDTVINIVMTKFWSIVMTRAMEHCDDKVMEHCDEKNSGAL